MSVNAYLNNLASQAIVSDTEREKINISIKNIISKLKNHLKNDIQDIFIFGSYKRHTNLPRKFDEDSDVDIMIVFNEQYDNFKSFLNNHIKPQTYITKLKKFIESSYPNSIVFQSFPAAVLELNHIKFDLVPAIKECDNYKIPTKDHIEWIQTNPNDLDNELKNNNNLRKLVRIAKIWNARQDIYESYELEKFIIECCSFYDYENLAEYFYKFCEVLPINYNLSQTKKTEVQRLKDNAIKAQQCDDSNDIKNLFE